MVADLHTPQAFTYGPSPAQDASMTSAAPTTRWSGGQWAVPALVVAALGIVGAYLNARHSTGQAHFALLWLAFAVGLVTVVWAGVRPAASLRARLGLMLGWGLLTFLPKFLMSMNGPAYFDEYGHWRHANDIVSTGHLDVASHYLPIVRYYPGLEVLTAWVHDVTRLSTWHVGQAIVLFAHCLVLLVI